MKKLISILSAFVLCVSLCSCGKEEKKEKEIEIPILDTNGQSPGDFNTQTVEKGTISESFVLPGQFAYPYISYVSVNKGGVVKTLNFDSDDELKAGQLLIEFENESMDIAIEAQEQKVKEAQDNYDSLKKNGASKARLDVAQVDIDIEKNNLDSLLEQADAYKVYAPIDGFIELANLMENYKVGSTVEDGHRIGRIVDRSQKYLCASTYGQRLDNVEYGTRVELIQGEVASGTGKVMDIIRRDRGEFSTIEYVIDIDDDVEFYDFGEINVVFSVYKKEDVVLVPKSSIVEVGERTFVYTIVDGIRIETDVELGRKDEIKKVVEVTSGLDGGETILVMDN